jgi:hypothetical protein
MLEILLNLVYFTVSDTIYFLRAHMAQFLNSIGGRLSIISISHHREHGIYAI